MTWYPDWMVALDDVAKGVPGAVITQDQARKVISALEQGNCAWVLESGDCNFGDHEIVQVFLGSQEEADARAAELSRLRSPLDEVMAFAYPVTRGSGQ